MLACAPGTSHDVANRRACDETPVEDGTVRVKWYACAEEIDAQQFEARRGDVLLQSAHLSVAIRSPWVSLTRLDRPGGTLIDAAGPGQNDWVLEALPDMEQGTGFTLLDDGVAVDVEPKHGRRRGGGPLEDGAARHVGLLGRGLADEGDGRRPTRARRAAKVTPDAGGPSATARPSAVLRPVTFTPNARRAG